jgi:voltage-gated potassium channel
MIVEGVIGQAWRRRSMQKRIESISDHYVVCGVGSTGKHVIEELVATGKRFVAIDRDPDHLARTNTEVGDGEMLYVCGNATEDHTLIQAGVARASGVIAALTDDRDNLYVTLSARTLNSRARIVSKVIEPEAVPKMIRAGANATVSPNTIGGRRLAAEMLRPEVVEFLDQMMRDRKVPFRFEEVPVPEESSAVGKTLGELGIRKLANVLVVAVRDRDRKFVYNPGPDHVLAGGTVLVVLGDSREAAKLGAVFAS